MDHQFSNNKSKGSTYKISLVICSFIIVFLSGHFVFAQGKGYFYERGNEFNVFDNLIVNGYLIVENTKTDRVGFSGDVMIDNNFSLDVNSFIYFCKDERVGTTSLNRDCANKVLIWYPNPGNLEAVDPDFYQIQINKVLAHNNVINIESANTVRALKQIKLTGCFSNDGSQDCVLGGTCNGGPNNGMPSSGGCPLGTVNKGEVKTGYFYTDNLANLDLKTNNINTIKVVAYNLRYKSINLGSAGQVDFQNAIKIGGSDKKEKLDLQNICWKAAIGTACANSGYPANGGVNYKWNFGYYAGSYFPYESNQPQ